MSRPSLREQRRAEIAAALVRVLGTHGSAGASIAAVAAEAGVAPGLVHHHFSDRQDLFAAALDVMVAAFRARTRETDTGEGALVDYADAALALGARADVVAARAWVGLFAEAVSDPVLFDAMRRVLATEVAAIQRRSRDELTAHDASAVLAFIVGALVFGAFAPRVTAGFAAPALRRFLMSLDTNSRNAR